MDAQEDVCVERATRYAIAFEESLTPLRQNIPREAFLKLYEEGCEEWTKTQRLDPGLMFTPGDEHAQGVFYHNIDSICASLNSVRKDDWNRFFFSSHRVTSSLTAPPSLLRISSAAQTGLFHLTVGGQQFTSESPVLSNIRERMSANM